MRLLLDIHEGMKELKGSLNLVTELLQKMHKEAHPDFELSTPIKEWDDRMEVPLVRYKHFKLLDPFMIIILRPFLYRHLLLKTNCPKPRQTMGGPSYSRSISPTCW